VEKQIQIWKSYLPEVQVRIKQILAFFEPSTLPKKVIFIPSDKIVSENSGMSFVVNGDTLICSHTTNKDSFSHKPRGKPDGSPLGFIFRLLN
jgi:hypothetical protein